MFPTLDAIQLVKQPSVMFPTLKHWKKLHLIAAVVEFRFENTISEDNLAFNPSNVSLPSSCQCRLTQVKMLPKAEKNFPCRLIVINRHASLTAVFPLISDDLRRYSGETASAVVYMIPARVTT